MFWYFLEWIPEQSRKTERNEKIQGKGAHRHYIRAYIMENVLGALKYRAAIHTTPGDMAQSGTVEGYPARDSDKYHYRLIYKLCTFSE